MLSGIARDCEHPQILRMRAADRNEPAEHEGHVLPALSRCFEQESSSKEWMASTCKEHSEHRTWSRDLQFMNACS